MLYQVYYRYKSTNSIYFSIQLVPSNVTFSLSMQQGWSYVGDRLLSAVVPYEETGWYDGQMWVKPPEVSSICPSMKQHLDEENNVRLQSHDNS